MPDDAVTRALYRVWCASTDSALSPDFEGDEEARERYRLAVMAEARKELIGLRGAAIAMTAMHDVGRGNLHLAAVLRAWLVARQRGIANTPAAGGTLGTNDCDALAHAAVDAVFERLAEWAAERDDEEAGPRNIPGAGWCEIHQAYHLNGPGDVKGDPLSVVIPRREFDALPAAEVFLSPAGVPGVSAQDAKLNEEWLRTELAPTKLDDPRLTLARTDEGLFAGFDVATSRGVVQLRIAEANVTLRPPPMPDGAVDLVSEGLDMQTFGRPWLITSAPSRLTGTRYDNAGKAVRAALRGFPWPQGWDNDMEQAFPTDLPDRPVGVPGTFIEEPPEIFPYERHDETEG
jgi:hypothetical protein